MGTCSVWRVHALSAVRADAAEAWQAADGQQAGGSPGRRPCQVQQVMCVTLARVLQNGSDASGIEELGPIHRQYVTSHHDYWPGAPPAVPGMLLCLRVRCCDSGPVDCLFLSAVHVAILQASSSAGHTIGAASTQRATPSAPALQRHPETAAPCSSYSAAQLALQVVDTHAPFMHLRNLLQISTVQTSDEGCLAITTASSKPCCNL